jgi:hypothetical protein
MKDNLSKYKTAEELIKAIRNSSDQILRVEMGPLKYYIKVLKKLGFSYRDDKDFAANGWQIDFWAYFKKQDTIVVLYGSLYEGNFKLTIDDNLIE